MARPGRSTSPTLSVRVSDPDNNAMTVTFMGRPFASGNFAQIAQKTNVASGATTTTPWSNIGAGQKFEWFVTASDGTTTTTGPTWTFRTTAAADPVFVGVGDIAACTNTNDTDTGNVISGIDGTIFTVGDNVYPDGTAADFTNCYAPTPWGAAASEVADAADPRQSRLEHGQPERVHRLFRRRWPPTPTGRATTATTSRAATGTSSISTASAPRVTGGCAAGSPQELWLKADLQANLSKNVIALWHKPRFSSAGTNLTELQAFVDDLYAAGADIAMYGHDHVYERIAQLNADRCAGPRSRHPLLHGRHGW